MSTKTQLLLSSALSVLLGLATVAIGATSDITVLVVLGSVVVAIGLVLVVGTSRWLRPSTRLPVQLREATAGDWRNTLVTLELADGTHIYCVVIRPGGYVVPRDTDPPFDTRQVVSVRPATDADSELEDERQGLAGRT